MIIGDSSNS